MYNLIEYSENYSKTSGSLGQYCNKIHAINNNRAIVNFNDGDDGIINVEIMVPLKYLSNFWRNLEMFLINCQAELILNWSANCVIVYTNINNEVPIFTIPETNLLCSCSYFINSK